MTWKIHDYTVTLWCTCKCFQRHGIFFHTDKLQYFLYCSIKMKGCVKIAMCTNVPYFNVFLVKTIFFQRDCIYLCIVVMSATKYYETWVLFLCYVFFSLYTYSFPFGNHFASLIVSLEEICLSPYKLEVNTLNDVYIYLIL